MSLGQSIVRGRIRHYVIIAVIVGIVGFLSIVIVPNHVYASGGGGGGSGGGGGGGGTCIQEAGYPCNQDGNGWAQYTLSNLKWNSNVPTLGFINGTTLWNNIYTTCYTNDKAKYADIYIIQDVDGNGEGYNYNTTDYYASDQFSGSVDSDQAQEISNDTAYADFELFAEVYPGDVHGTWDGVNTGAGPYKGVGPYSGGTISWFCAKIPTPTINASSSANPTSLSSGQSTTFTHNVAVSNAISTDKANFTWAIKSCYSSSGSCGSTSYTTLEDSGGPQNTTADFTKSKSYTFPGSAPSGAEYCQRLYVNPGDNSIGITTLDTMDTGPAGESDLSPTSGWYHDNGTCVTLTTSSWTLSGQTKVGASTLLPGESTTFNSRVYNNGPSNASYWWWVQGCSYTSSQGSGHCSASSGNYNDDNCTTNNDGASPCNLHTDGTSTSYITCPNDAYCPAYDTGKAAENFSFPSTAGPGDGYCERIGYGNASGPGAHGGGTPNGFSTPKCTSYDTPPSTTGGLIDDCSAAELNMGPDTSWWNGDATAHYAIYALPSGSQPTANTIGGLYPPSDLNGNVYNSSSAVGPSTDQPQPPPFNLSPSQYISGNVSWYAVIYNYPSNASLATAGLSSDDGDIYVANYFTGTGASSNCFQASCTISVAGTLGGNNTKAGVPFPYQVTVTNNGSNSLGTGFEATPAYYTGYTATGATGTEAGPLDPGESSPSPLTFTSTPNNDDVPNNLNINLTYQGKSLSGLQGCSQTVYDYEYTTVTPGSVAEPTPGSGATDEDLTSFSYDTSGNLSGVPADDQTTSCIYYQPAGSPSPNLPTSCSQVISGQYVNAATEHYGSGLTYIAPSSGSPPGTYVPPSTQAGDQYCSYINLAWTSAWVNSSGNVLSQSTLSIPPTSSECVTVHNEPYAQFFGNDVIGDSAFNATSGTATCGAGGDTSGIYTFSQATTSSSGTSKGSYTQFGAQALNIIEGLGSAGLRPSSSPPTGPNDLTFSNTDVSSSSTADGTGLGGNFGSSLCASPASHNYFSDELPTTTTYTTGISLPTGPGDYDYTANPGLGGTTTIGSSSPPTSTADVGTITVDNGVNTAIFVSGNAYIDSNIVFSGAGSWSKLSDIPSLWIIASGNIYIDPNVTELDGVFVAQPNSTANTGVIDTCATTSSGSSYPLADIYGGGSYSYLDSSGNSHNVTVPGCNNQLTINGAFIDQATELDRSFSSVRYSATSPVENPQDTSTHTCGTAGKDINSTTYTSSTLFPTCAAEVFNFSPETYLSQPALKANPGKLDYITSLSPVL